MRGRSCRRASRRSGTRSRRTDRKTTESAPRPSRSGGASPRGTIPRWPERKPAAARRAGAPPAGCRRTATGAKDATRRRRRVRRVYPSSPGCRRMALHGAYCHAPWGGRRGSTLLAGFPGRAPHEVLGGPTDAFVAVGLGLVPEGLAPAVVVELRAGVLALLVVDRDAALAGEGGGSG